MSIYKPAQPGEEAFIFNTGSCEADLYFASNIDRHDKPQRPGHGAGPGAGPHSLKTSHGGAVDVRHQISLWTETQG